MLHNRCDRMTSNQSPDRDCVTTAFINNDDNCPRSTVRTHDLKNPSILLTIMRPDRVEIESYDFNNCREATPGPASFRRHPPVAHLVTGGLTTRV